MDNVSEPLKSYYKKIYELNGHISLGVDWGIGSDLANFRQLQMLNLITRATEPRKPVNLFFESDFGLDGDEANEEGKSSGNKFVDPPFYSRRLADYLSKRL